MERIKTAARELQEDTRYYAFRTNSRESEDGSFHCLEGEKIVF